MAEKTQLNLLVNAYFATMGAGDRMLKEIERNFRAEGCELKHEIKQAHTKLMEAVHTTRAIYYQYFELSKIDCMVHAAGGDYDKALADEYDFARLILTYADRADTMAKANRVMEWMHYLPEQLISDEYLKEHFTLK